MQNLVSHKYSTFSAAAILMTFILIFSLTSPLAAANDATGSIEGVVYKNDGETPLRDAQIVLRLFEKGKEKDKEYKSNVTDETGKYVIENIPEGKYKGKIMIGKKHYKIKRVDFFVHVVAGEINYLSFSLKRRK